MVCTAGSSIAWLQHPVCAQEHPAKGARSDSRNWTQWQLHSPSEWSLTLVTRDGADLRDRGNCARIAEGAAVAQRVPSQGNVRIRSGYRIWIPGGGMSKRKRPFYRNLLGTVWKSDRSLFATGAS